MTAPRDRLNRIRSVGNSVMALAPARMRTAEEDHTIYARAVPETAEITEDYFIRQEISKNSSLGLGAPPTGLVELAVPYDGSIFFGRQAIEDVTKAAEAQGGTADGTAVIGHLLFHDFNRTSLADDLELRDKRGSIPVRAEIGQGQDGRFEYLSSDRQSCVTRYEYDPATPSVDIAHLKIELFDPDSLDLPILDLIEINLATKKGQDNVRAAVSRHVGDVTAKIRQQVNFKNELKLQLVARLNLPVKQSESEEAERNLRPRITRMTIGWPTITSIRTLSLRIGDKLLKHGTDVSYDDVEPPVRYNPTRRDDPARDDSAQGCLEWVNVRMDHESTMRGDGDLDILTYESVPMLLAIQHPGELFKQPHLKVCAEIEIKDYLASGLTARLFDATGSQINNKPRLTTRVQATTTLILQDAFAKRTRSPYQHLVFDEIIPDEMRITDIVTTLKDQGFEVLRVLPDEQQAPLGHAQAAGTVNWLLAAQRQEGPESMDMWIFVEGRHYETERETTAFGGGVVHKTKLNSGELRIFIRGTLARDSWKLTHEMNALQQTLRDRYERVRQRR
jgi:hypothetical protein